MIFSIIIGITFVTLLIVMSVVIFLPQLLRQGAGVPHGAPAPNPPAPLAPAPAVPAPTHANWYHRIPRIILWIIGSIVAVAVFWIVYTLILSISVNTSQDLTLYGILGIALIASVIGWSRGGDNGTIWIGRIIMTIIVIIAVYVIYLHVFYGNNAMKVHNAWIDDNTRSFFGESQPTKTVVEPTVTQGSATWNKTNGDGTLPVNVWSEVTPVGVGCMTKFTFGVGHRVQYRYYSKEWNDYVQNTSPNASELRFMVTKEGVKTFPYTVTCS